MQDNQLRKRLLGGRKTERIIFAVTPEAKLAAERLARERCVSVSALLNDLLAEEAGRNGELFSDLAASLGAAPAADKPEEAR